MIEKIIDDVEFPKGWFKINLDQVAIWGSGGTPSRRIPGYFQGDIPWIKTGELKSKYVRDMEEKITEQALQKSSAKIFAKGSVAIAMYGATIGRTSILDVDAASNQACAIAQPIKGIIFNEFLYYYLLSQLREFVKLGKGGAQPNISQTVLKSHPIFLPHYPEQLRIVAKIEELFSELDAGIESLKIARSQLKIYRQAVLKWAFEGKLTAEWRQQRQGKLKSADELLEQIKIDRENHYQQQFKDWESEVKNWESEGGSGKRPTKPHKLKEVRPPHNENTYHLLNLPDGWNWIFPEDIASPENYSLGIGPFGSNLKVSDYAESGFPLVFVRHITSGDFKINSKFISYDKFQELLPHAVKPLDLLVTKMGDPPGDCEIYPAKSMQGIITSDCLKFRVWDKFVNRDFYKYCINSTLVKKQLGLITKGVAQKKISLERFRGILLPLPNFQEQNKIVQEIESRLSICDNIETTIEENLQRAESLRQSILKQAFTGKLVPQDPNDEPAAQLLARIQQKQSAQQTLPLKPRKPAKKTP